MKNILLEYLIGMLWKPVINYCDEIEKLEKEVEEKIKYIKYIKESMIELISNDK